MPINFKVVDSACSEFALVEKVFNTTIANLYGPQATALSKVGESKDRICEMLFVNDVPRGIIIYKKSLQENNALELKTLCVLESKQESNKGYGTLLLNRVMDTAARRNADNILVTVSAENRPALGFFEHKGFAIIQRCQGKYKPDVTENILNYRVQRQLTAHITAQTTPILPLFRRSAPTATTTTTTSSAPDLTCTLKGQYVRAIASGRKTFEGRVATPFFRSYTPGKTVSWSASQNLGDQVTTEIISRTEFRSFRDMLTRIGYEKFVPEVRSLEEAIRIYDNIPGYAEKVRLNGAVALEVRVISPRNTPNYQNAARSNTRERSRERYTTSDRDTTKRYRRG